MYHIKKISIITFVLIAFLSTVNAADSHAISDWDNSVFTTTKLEAGGNGSTDVQDITTTYMSLISPLSCYQSLQNTISNINDQGSIGVFVATHANGSKVTYILWSEYNPSRQITAEIDPVTSDAYFELKPVWGTYVSGARIFDNGSAGHLVADCNTHTSAVSAKNIQNSGLDVSIYFSTFPVIYPLEYEGINIPVMSIDADNDGLALWKELYQSTNDFNSDTDNDGLNDYKESIWFTNRDEVFCNKTTSPYTCAYPDPTTQDLYIEIDWMYDSIENRSFMPTALQLKKIQDVFDAQNINLYADTGQFGGGNEIPFYGKSLHISSTDNYIDFDDIKYGYDSYSANYKSDREGIWRYMISGYHYSDSPTSSGIAEVGGSNSFISNGLVKDTFTYSNLDDAIAGTMIHEIGHNLCLSNVAIYVNQPSTCVFDGVDSSGILYTLYQSSMNYQYQLETTNLSDGTHELGDHADWSAVKVGISDFAKTRTPISLAGKSYSKNLAFDTNLAAPNEMTPEMSRQIYEENKKSQSPSVSNEESQTSTTPNSNDQQFNASSQRTQQSKFSDETNQQNHVYLWLFAAGTILLIISIIALVIRRKKTPF